MVVHLYHVMMGEIAPSMGPSFSSTFTVSTCYKEAASRDTHSQSVSKLYCRWNLFFCVRKQYKRYTLGIYVLAVLLVLGCGSFFVCLSTWMDVLKTKRMSLLESDYPMISFFSLAKILLLFFILLIVFMVLALSFVYIYIS